MNSRSYHNQLKFKTSSQFAYTGGSYVTHISYIGQEPSLTISFSFHSHIHHLNKLGLSQGSIS
ncbi:MAG: hypothetical protein LBC61_00130 [Candidatus Peribacteria bacterium]|nr:hypothetical protein [Candidatus Peribacteria bacterium]